MPRMTEAGSPSIEDPTYWWYQARADLLRTTMEEHADDAEWLLDVGSADGPSVGWLRGRRERVALDVDPRGLEDGDVCGSATALPFRSESFGTVAAFDVIEHCDSESTALAEIHRVLRPGGHLLMSVPAYEWAWTHHDDLNGHYRRYTRTRARRAVEAAGFEVVRATYAFCGTFPFFAADRLLTRLRQRRLPAPVLRPDEVAPLPSVGRVVEKVLLGATALDRRLLGTRDLPFGSSVLLVARKQAVA